jgi:type IV secretion system protein VirB2
MGTMGTKKLRKWTSAACLAFVLVLLGSGVAGATGSSSAGLPWEATIKMVADSLSGPVAFSICVLGIFASGVAIVFGADLPGWVRTVAQVALVAALIGMSGQLLAVFGLSSATVL